MTMRYSILLLALLLYSINISSQEAINNMDRLKLSREKYRELFLSEPEPDKETDPELMEILRRFIFGEVFYTGNLSDSRRELLTLMALTSNQALPQLKAHTNAALNVGIEPVIIREAIYQCAPFIGFPKTLNAINAVNEVFTSRNIPLPLENKATVTEHDRHAKGREIQQPLYGNKIKENLGGIPQNFRDTVPDMLTSHCFGDFYTRGGLDVKDRELLVLALLVSEGAERQIRSHVEGNLKAGNSKETLYSAIIHLIPYIGFPKSLDAIYIINESH